MIIQFEGHDGVGKSAVIIALKDALESQNYKVTIYKTPADHFQKERDIIDKAGDMKASYDFYIKCCKYTSTLLNSSEGKFDFILLDRYYHSTVVSHKCRGYEPNSTDHLNSFHEADIKIWIQISEGIRLSRIKKRGIIQQHDLDSFKNNIKRQADLLYSEYTFHVVVNDGDISNTLKNVEDIILKVKSLSNECR